MQGQLGPRRLGAEVLADIAAAHLTGTLTVRQAAVEQQLRFVDGRPEAASGSVDRAKVVQAVRAAAVSTAGEYSFSEGDAGAGGKLGVDTLGEVLVAVLRDLKPVQLDAFVGARASQRTSVTPRFAKLAAAIGQLGGPLLQEPAIKTTLGRLIAGGGSDVQRAWAAMLVLGGLRVEGEKAAPVLEVQPTERASAPVELAGQPPAMPAEVVPPADAGAPQEVEAQRVYFEVRKAHGELQGLNHYDLFEVGPGADIEQIRRAYFECAKRWHGDRLAGLKLDAETRRMADALFKMAEAAFRVLSDPEERRKYDAVLDRQAQGLPTDPKVMMNAQQAFSRGARMVQQGNAAGAEVVLKEAVDLNPGEAEYWVYYGYALFCAKGHDVAELAREHIRKGLKMNERLDAGYEFLGRIARIEGDVKGAETNFRIALRANANNVGAQRELRLLRMRGTGDQPTKTGLRGLLDKVLKRRGS